MKLGMNEIDIITLIVVAILVHVLFVMAHI